LSGLVVCLNQDFQDFRIIRIGLSECVLFAGYWMVSFVCFPGLFFCLFGCLCFACSLLILLSESLIKQIIGFHRWVGANCWLSGGLGGGNEKRAPLSREEGQTVGSVPFLVGLDGARQVLEIGGAMVSVPVLKLCRLLGCEKSVSRDRSGVMR